jgi:TonB-dependent receptor
MRGKRTALARIGAGAALTVSSVCTHAQDAAATTEPQAGDAPALEEIEVIGYRFAQRRTADLKRNAEGVIDAVSSDDLGKLPDKNAAESLDRLPGVSITVDQGEGRYVSIRGVSPTLNNTTINGVYSGSPEADSGGRLVPLDVVGSDLLSRIEVIKMQTPDMDGQGIGGTVNIVTKGPFDYRELLTAIGSVQAGYDSLNDKHPYSGQLTLAGLSDDRHWGWLLGGSYQYRDAESHGIYQDDWGTVTSGDVSANLPTNAKNTIYGLERQRTGYNAQLEWRPEDGQRYYVRGFYSDFREKEERQRYQYLYRQTVATLDEDGSGTSGSNNRRTQDLRLERKDKRLANVALGGENTLGAWLGDYVAQFNDNRQEEPNRVWSWRKNGFGPASWSVNHRGLVDVAPDEALSVPESLPFYSLTEQDNQTKEKAGVFALNLRRVLDDEGSYLKFGGKYTRTRRDNDDANTAYGPGSETWTLADFDHFGGSLRNHVGGLDLPNMRVDTGAAKDFLDENIDDDRYFKLKATDTFNSAYSSDYKLTEKIAAGYLMGNWRRGGFSLIPGVRVEHTDIDASAFVIGENDDGDPTADPVSGKGNYTNWLPALIARYEFDNWVVRAGWTNTVGRPDYDQIAPIASLDPAADEGPSLTIGNPELKARESRNYDVSIEWYFARSDFISLAAFYKDLRNQIVNRIQTANDYTFQGVSYDTLKIHTVENANSGKVRGVELGYQQQLHFLPSPFDGLGLAFSYARLHSETQVEGRDDDPPLTQQPKWTVSGTLFYQRGPFSLALSDSEAGAYLGEVGETPDQDLYEGKYGRLDLQAGYDIDPRWSVYFQAQNLNNEPTTEYQGGDKHQKTQYEVYGRTYYLGVSVRL